MVSSIETVENDLYFLSRVAIRRYQFPSSRPSRTKSSPSSPPEKLNSFQTEQSVQSRQGIFFRFGSIVFRLKSYFSERCLISVDALYYIDKKFSSILTKYKKLIINNSKTSKIVSNICVIDWFIFTSFSRFSQDFYGLQIEVFNDIKNQPVE